jgi:RNA polymerase sigma-70 factor, ECF subfamily
MVITNEPIDSLDQEALLAQARAGDTEVYCRLIQPLESRLLGQAMGLCRDLHAAEDLVSETLVEGWKSLSRYDESCRLSTWLYAILLHRYQKYLRRIRRRPIPLSWLPWFEAEEKWDALQNMPSIEPSPEGRAIQDERLEAIEDAMVRLSEKHRAAVLLRFFEDATLEDMARVLNCSVGTVKSRLHHALRKLRKMKLNLSEVRGDTKL